MRLHSDFHDYYDTAIGFGVDQKVYYNRITKPVRIVLKRFANLPTQNECGLLGFCGRIYPFIELLRYEWKTSSDGSRTEGKVVERYFAYSTDDWILKRNEWELYRGADDRTLAKTLRLDQFFGDWSFQSDDVFLQFGTPSWVLRFNRNDLNGVINPRLKDFAFDRIKDSTTAFQEISMYLPNILVEQKEVVHVEDKFRIQQHGFDLKSSFRNPKQKKS